MGVAFLSDWGISPQFQHHQNPICVCGSRGSMNEGSVETPIPSSSSDTDVGQPYRK